MPLGSIPSVKKKRWKEGRRRKGKKREREGGVHLPFSPSLRIAKGLTLSALLKSTRDLTKE